MKLREIEIVIDIDGTVTSEQIGWEGNTCHGAIDELIKQIGKKVDTKRNKDYFKEKKVRINQTSR